MTYNPEAHAQLVREVIDSLWLPDGISLEVAPSLDPGVFRWPSVNARQTIDGTAYGCGYAVREYEDTEESIKRALLYQVSKFQRFILDTRNGVTP